MQCYTATGNCCTGFHVIRGLELQRWCLNKHLYVQSLILRVLVWHLLGSTTVIILPCMLTRGGIRLVIADSHIQHFVLAA